MNISSYKTFIESIDVCNIKVERRKRSNFWIQSMKMDKDVNDCISSLKNLNNVYSISRNDVFSEKNDKNKVTKALFWGYPSLKINGRKNLSEIIVAVLPFLVKSKNNVVNIEEIKQFNNTCLSLDLPQGAYTKFLYFFKIKYKQGEGCLIVDRFLEIGMKEFSDFSNFTNDYLDICKQINMLAKKMKALPEQLEYFLFFVGRHVQYQGRTFRAILKYKTDE